MHYSLLLLGGGHSHALMLAKWRLQGRPAGKIALVSDHALSPYSGMLPGLVAGHYSHQDCFIELPRLCQSVGIDFIPASVLGLDADRRLVQLASHSLSFDWLSINTGGQPRLPPTLQAQARVVPVKPVSDFLQAYDQARLTTQEEDWLVVGGGAGAVEIVLAMAHRLGHPSNRVRLTLAYSGQLLPGYPAVVRRRVRRQLAAYGIVERSGFRWCGWQDQQATGQAGQSLPASRVWLCTPVQPPEWLNSSGLTLTKQGFISVSECLQSTSHSSVFAAGDIADCLASPRAKAGVFAVRQAPFLAHNLRAALLGNELQPVQLQTTFVSLLALGQRQAIGSRGRLPLALPWHCPRLEAWLWQQKNSIDRRFMRQFE